MKSVLSLSRIVSCIALAVAATACGDDVPAETGDTSAGEPDVSALATSAPETTVPETSPPETTTPDAPVASDADAVSVAPEPVAQPEPTPAPAEPSRADLVLRSNGVAGADFGQVDIDVIPVVTALLGDPINDRLGEYPTFDEDVYLYVDFEDTGFSAPFGRTTCYDNEFCLNFGGDTGDDLRFVGWSQGGFEPASEPLVSADGVTIGSRYSDHLGVMTVSEGGCFTEGFGEVAGITLFVTSESVPFVSVDDTGNYVTQTPDPAEIVVRTMKAGDEPFYIYSDC